MSKKVSAFTNDILGTNDAVAIALLIKSKQISAAEVINAAIERAEKVNPELNAFVVKTYDLAKNQVLKNRDSLLSGVPTVIKDNTQLNGLPSQHGTGAFTAKAEKKTGKYATQFLSTGMVSIGKSTLPEFGLICSTENPAWGITRNPWDTDYTTGGSSSGSAALVAAGVVPIASANDGAGSIRIPASCCGLVGLKPSRGRLLHTDGTNLMPINIVCEGVVTRSVRDTAAYFSEAEKHYKNKNILALGLVETAAKKRLRILFFEEISTGKLGHQDSDTASTQAANIKLLESLGHTVEMQPYPFAIEDNLSDFLNYYGFMYTAVQFAVARNIDKTKLEPFTVGVGKHFKKNIWRFPSSIKNMKKLARDFDGLFNSYDIVVTPTLAHAVPKIGHLSALLSYDEIKKRVTEFAPFTAVQNISGSPAISLPMGVSADGLPIGMQYCAGFGQEKKLLELAFELETAQPWKFLYQQ
jgi:amidase